MAAPLDLTGQRFGDLIALECTGTVKSGNGTSRIWLCRCEHPVGEQICGKLKTVRSGHLRSGRTTSCGGHRATTATCSAEGCDGKVRARGMCNKHWQQWDRAQHPGRSAKYNKTFTERHPGRRNAQAKARYAKEPAKHIENSRRAIVKRKYGITLEEYEAIIARGCAICLRKGKSGPGGLALDHCHATGKIRDALCTRCNNGLGSFGDDPDRLRRAASYIETHRKPLTQMEMV